MDLFQIALVIFAGLVVILTVCYYVKRAAHNKKARKAMAALKTAPAVVPISGTAPVEPVAIPGTRVAPVVPAVSVTPSVAEASATRDSAPKSPAASVVPNSSQITLYEFPYHSGIQICPGCDAENKHSYRFCWVCGYKMS